MNQPLVTCITPTANRPEHLKKCIEQFIAQDYVDKWMVIVMPDNVLANHVDMEWYTELCQNNVVPIEVKFYDGSIGDKRNLAISTSPCDIILHIDDDDTYSPDWITKSVEYLISTKADITGLSNAYFYQPPVLYEYKYGGGQPYVIGASMCYWRRVWGKKQFKNTNSGEDAIFQQGCKVVPHHYKNSFIANIHGGNTASHLQLHKMLKITNEITIKNILDSIS